MKKNRLPLLICTVLVLLLVLCSCACNHEYGEWTVVTPATCVKTGEQTRTCSACNQVEHQEIPLAEHTYGKEKVTKEASCSEKGSKEQTCSICNKTTTAEIPLIEHAWTPATCAAPKTCTVCNTQQGNPASHSYNSQQLCTVCNAENPKLAELKANVTIYGTFISVNSADGVNLYVTWENESAKEIKYITFAVQLYNKVNDPITCTIRKNYTEYVKQTGPIPQGKGMYTSARTDATGYAAIFKNERVTFAQFKEDKANGWAEERWETVWYNSTAHYAKVVGVEIEYMDGTTYNCQDQALFDCIGAQYLNRNQDKNTY